MAARLSRRSAATTGTVKRACLLVTMPQRSPRASIAVSSASMSSKRRVVSARHSV